MELALSSQTGEVASQTGTEFARVAAIKFDRTPVCGSNGEQPLHQDRTDRFPMAFPHRTIQVQCTPYRQNSTAPRSGLILSSQNRLTRVKILTVHSAPTPHTPLDYVTQRPLFLPAPFSRWEGQPQTRRGGASILLRGRNPAESYVRNGRGLRSALLAGVVSLV